MPDLTKTAMAPSRRRLITLIQSIHFGRIERLAILEGQPIFSPSPRIVRTLKVGGGRNSSRPKGLPSDFALKQEVVELFHQLTRIGNGVIEKIEVVDGLPVFLEIAEVVAP